MDMSGHRFPGADPQGRYQQPYTPFFAFLPVDRYHLWFDLREGTHDLQFADAVEAYLEHLSERNKIVTWLLERRKLGFGPPELGEWHIVIETQDMGQLEKAFQAVVPRSGDVEELHAAVWRHVVGLRTALYRDFPDPQRQ